MVGVERVVSHWSLTLLDLQSLGHGVILRNQEHAQENMPYIPPPLLNCTFYLYPSESDAKKGRKFGGTGFFVGISSEVDPSKYHVIAITNWHVAIRDKATVVRVMTETGGTDIISTNYNDWIAHPDGFDMAACPLRLDHTKHEFTVIETKTICTRKQEEDFKISVGDDVVMIGRFIDNDGGTTNIPAARFGYVSMMPTPMAQGARGQKVESYCIDVHSRTGYSGSPVFVFRNHLQALSAVDYTPVGKQFIMCLGLHYGQFPEIWKLKPSGKVRVQSEPRRFIGEAEITGMSGMTCVIPGWAIHKLLEHSKIELFVSQEEEKIRLLGQEAPILE